MGGVSANQMLEAIDKALVMGASMDGKLLKEAADAHHKAIGSVDAKLVTSAGDFEAVNAALGKVIASVPTSQVMDVYNAFGKIVSPVIPNYLYSSVNPADAQAAYTALLGFKDVVKAAQRRGNREPASGASDRGCEAGRRQVTFFLFSRVRVYCFFPGRAMWRLRVEACLRVVFWPAEDEIETTWQACAETARKASAT